ncbi:MAG: accessory gene regulator B family protein [Bacillota bacterium]|nr:accessory gene regulator B family protein [Bacillota bacterium]
MGIINKISNLLIQFVKNNVDKTDEEIEKIKYGIQVIIMNIFKMFILFITAYFLRILIYTLIAFIAFGILRSFASGVHADSSMKCILLNYMVFLGNVYFSLSFSLNRVLITILFLISLILIINYAPADTAERPLISKELRKELKIKAIITLFIFGILSLLLSNSIYGKVITYSTFEEAFFITPLCYKIFGKPYRNYENIKL